MDMSTFQTIKHIDPIWKRLLFNRIWVLFFLVYLVVYLYVEISQLGGAKSTTSSFSTLYLLFFFPLLLLIDAIGHFRHEQYWKRIGLRRLEALQDAQPFLAKHQPFHDASTLTLPVTVRMRWNRLLVIVVFALALIPIVLFAIIGFLVLLQHNHASDFFLPLIISTFLLLIVGFTIYMVAIRYQFSFIQITEEGIKTRYMRQERFIRWDEARVFASYGAQGLKKSTYVFTYELANEQTVVRWSEQMLSNLFLTLETTGTNRDDWNWLIGCINALVATRTGLPLLNLGDSDQQKLSRPARYNSSLRKQPVSNTPIPSYNTPERSIRIAQDDPIIRRLQWRGETGKSILLTSGIAIVVLLFGLFGMFLNYGQYQFALFSLNMAHFLLWGGILLLGIMILAIVFTNFARKYWSNIEQKRQEAFQQPERFLPSAQPEPYLQLPSITSVHMRTRKSVFFLISLAVNFILWLFFTATILQLHRSFLATLIVTFLFALLMSLFTLPFTGRSTENRIEIKTDGIRTRFGTADTYVKWEETRLFATYKAQRLIKNSSNVQMYELASEHSVVRWHEFRARRWMVSLEPQMSHEEYDRWLAQLHGHIVAHTGLSLLNLDAASE